MKGMSGLVAVLLFWSTFVQADTEIGGPAFPVSLEQWDVFPVQRGGTCQPSCGDHLCSRLRLRNGSSEPLLGLVLDLRFYDRGGSLLHQEEVACPMALNAGATGELVHCWFAENGGSSPAAPFDRLRSAMERGQLVLGIEVRGAIYRTPTVFSAGRN